MLEEPRKSKICSRTSQNTERYKVGRRDVAIELKRLPLEKKTLRGRSVARTWCSFFRQFVRAFRGLDSGSIRSRGIDLINFHRRDRDSRVSRRARRRKEMWEGGVRRVQLDDALPLVRLMRNQPKEIKIGGARRKTSRHRVIVGVRLYHFPVIVVRNLRKIEPRRILFFICFLFFFLLVRQISRTGLRALSICEKDWYNYKIDRSLKKRKERRYLIDVP